PHAPIHPATALRRPPPRPIAIGRGFQVRLEDRSQDQQRGGLHHPVPNRRNPERPLAATRLRNQPPPHRLGAVRLSSQRLLHCGQPSLQPFSFDVLERHAVHARRSAVLLTERIRVSEDIRPIHLVVEQVEAVGRFLLGLGVQRLLESLELRWSYQAHANLLPLDSLKRTPNQGAFPPCQFRCPAGASGTVCPSDARRRLADPPMVDRCPESFDKSVTLPAVSVATGANRQFPQAGPAPARALHLFTARRIISGFRRWPPRWTSSPAGVSRSISSRRMEC